MARRTRERILETALTMFNADGEPNITTNHIADELGISPGNLYYHFRNKDDIVARLYDAYESQMDEALALPRERAPQLDDLWLQLHLVFECMRDYRFIYRDLVDILARNRALRMRFARLLTRAGQAVRELLRGLRAADALHASDAALDALIENLLLIATFRMNYAAVRGVTHAGDGAELAGGVRQVMLLLAPYLREPERAHLARLAAAYD